MQGEYKMKRLRILPIILVVSLVSILILGAIPATLNACPIDIKPGSYPNSINLNSNGVVPVAVIGSADFSVEWIKPETVKFINAFAFKWSLENVNGDIYMDMVFHFKTQEIGLTSNSFEGSLTIGDTIWGAGSGFTTPPDTINIVPIVPKKK